MRYFTHKQSLAHWAMAHHSLQFSTILRYEYMWKETELLECVSQSNDLIGGIQQHRGHSKNQFKLKLSKIFTTGQRNIKEAYCAVLYLESTQSRFKYFLKLEMDSRIQYFTHKK